MDVFHITYSLTPTSFKVTRQQGEKRITRSASSVEGAAGFICNIAGVDTTPEVLANAREIARKAKGGVTTIEITSGSLGVEIPGLVAPAAEEEQAGEPSSEPESGAGSEPSTSDSPESTETDPATTLGAVPPSQSSSEALSDPGSETGAEQSDDGSGAPGSDDERES